MYEQVLARLIGFEDLEDVFWVVSPRIIVTDTRQIRITVTYVKLIARQSSRSRCIRTSRASSRAIDSFISGRFSVKTRGINIRVNFR